MKTGKELPRNEEMERCILSMLFGWPGNPAVVRFFYWFYQDGDKFRSYSFYLVDSPDKLPTMNVNRVLLDSKTKQILKERGGSVEEIAQNLSAQGITLVQVEIPQVTSIDEIQFLPIPDELLVNYAPLRARDLTTLCIEHKCQAFVDPFGFSIFIKEVAEEQTAS